MFIGQQSKLFVIIIIIVFAVRSEESGAATSTTGIVSCQTHGVPAIGTGGGLDDGPTTPGGGLGPSTGSQVTPPGQTGGVGPDGALGIKAGESDIYVPATGGATSSLPGGEGEIEVTITGGTTPGITVKRPGGEPVNGPEAPGPMPPSTGGPSGPGQACPPPSECGAGSGPPPAQDKQCQAPLVCDNCGCVDPRCSDPSSDCNPHSSNGLRCPPPLECYESNNGKLCRCREPTPGGGGGGRPQADLEKLLGDDSDFAPAGSEFDTGSSSGGGTASLTSNGSSVMARRPNRGGKWYWISSDYPGYLLNVMGSAVGEEIQQYVAGMRRTFAAISSNRYRLVKEEDSGGNVTLYEYDAAGKLVRKKLPTDILVEYIYQSNNQAFVLRTSRCLQAGYTSCQSIGQDETYRFDSAGRLIRRIGWQSPYVLEPTGVDGLHDLTNVQNDPVSFVYSYYPSDGKLSGITIERGSAVSISVASFSYYAVGGPHSGKLRQVTNARGDTTTYTYQANAVTATDSIGGQIHAVFDNRSRIIEYRVTPEQSRAGSVLYKSTRVTYAGNSNCDKVVSRLEQDSGDGTFREVMQAVWDTNQYRILSVSVPGPNGNTRTVTFGKFTHFLDGNVPEEIISPSGTALVTHTFVSHTDPTDSRFKIASITNRTVPVTDINGQVSVAESQVFYTPTGRIDYTVSPDGLLTKNYYGQGNLLRQVDSGPALSGGVPDMTHPASYSTALVRDPVTAEVVKITEGDPRKPRVTNYKYIGNTLTEVSNNGGGRVQYFRSPLGELAATRVYAADVDGKPFGRSGRTWYSKHTVRDQLGMVLYTASDVGDPRAATPEFQFERYFYNAAAELERVQPPFGHSTFFIYNSWGEIKEVRRDSANGLLLESYAYTPFTTTTRTLTGESNGQPTYLTATRNFNPAGYLVSMNSSLGRSAQFGYDDLGNLITGEASVGSARLMKFGLEYDSWGRVVKRQRYNPRTDAPEVMSSRLFAGDRLMVVYDQFGNAETYQYGRAGEKVGIKNATSTTQYDYQPGAGVVSKATVTSGTQKRVVAFEYDAAGRKSIEIDLGDGRGPGVATRYRYDTLGRAVVTGPDGRTPYSLQGPDGRLWESGLKGELDVSYSYALNPAASTYTIMQKVKGEGDRTFVIGPFGLVSSKDSDGRVTTVNYNNAGTVASTVGPDGAVTTPSYDSSGRALSTTIQNGATLEQWVTALDPQQRLGSVTKTVGNNVSRKRVLSYGDFSEIISFEEIEPGRAPVVTTLDRTAPNGRYMPNEVFGVTVGGATWKKDVDLRTGNLKKLDFIGGPNYTSQNPLRFELGYDGGVQSTLKYPASTGLEANWDYARGLLDHVAVTQSGNIVGGAQFERNSIGQVTKSTEINGSSKAFKYDGDRLIKVKDGVSQFGANYEQTVAQSETTIEYDTANPQQRSVLRLSNGTTLNYASDSKGGYSSIGGLSIVKDSRGRVVTFGDYTYVYEGSKLNPVEVKRLGVTVRRFLYDMGGNLYRSVDANGQSIDYLKSGTLDLGVLDPATGNLVRAFVTFPSSGTPREKLASVALTPNGQTLFFTHSGSTSPVGAYDIQGNLVERYDTKFGEGRLAIAAPNGSPRSVSVIGTEEGFHNLHLFPDSGPFGGIAITYARMLFPGLGIFNSPDPLGTIGQKVSFADNDPVLKSDPTGLQSTIGEVMMEINVEREASRASSGSSSSVSEATPSEEGPGWLSRLMSLHGQGIIANAGAQKAAGNAVVDCVYVDDWTSPDNSWGTNVAIATGQRVVQGIGIGLVAVPVGAGVVAAAPVAGPVALTTAGVALTGVGGYSTVKGIIDDGFTPQHAADTFLLGVPSAYGLRKLLCTPRTGGSTGGATGGAPRPIVVPPETTPAMAAATGDRSLGLALEVIDLTKPIERLCNNCSTGSRTLPSISLPDSVSQKFDAMTAVAYMNYWKLYRRDPQPNILNLRQFLGRLGDEVSALKSQIPNSGDIVSGVYVVLNNGDFRFLIGHPSFIKHSLLAHDCPATIYVAGEFRFTVDARGKPIGIFDNSSGTFMKGLGASEQNSRMSGLRELLIEVERQLGLEPGSIGTNFINLGN